MKINVDYNYSTIHKHFLLLCHFRMGRKKIIDRTCTLKFLPKLLDMQSRQLRLKQYNEILHWSVCDKYKLPKENNEHRVKKLLSRVFWLLQKSDNHNSVKKIAFVSWKRHVQVQPHPARVSIKRWPKIHAQSSCKNVTSAIKNAQLGGVNKIFTVQKWTEVRKSTMSQSINQSKPSSTTHQSINRSNEPTHNLLRNSTSIKSNWVIY